MDSQKAQEIDLARRLLAGDQSAFEPFVELFHSKLFHFTFMVCGQREDAEEVAQETLMKVFEHLDQLRDPEHIRPWVFRIARNICFIKRRKSVFAPSEEISLDSLKPAWKDEGGTRKLEIADWNQLPDRQAMDAETRDIVGKAIAALPEIYKSVLLLRDVEELSTAETAEILQVTEDVVKTRLHRARLAIRHVLDAQLRAGALA